MWMFKFKNKNKAKIFYSILEKFCLKENCLLNVTLKEELLLMNPSVEQNEKEAYELLKAYDNAISFFSGELVKPEKLNLEIIRFRFKDYEKCTPLENFEFSEKSCRLSNALLEGGTMLCFIGPESEGFVKSFLTHQYAIKQLRYSYPKDIKKLDWACKKASPTKVINIVLNENQKFFSFDLLSQHKYCENPYINLLICCKKDSALIPQGMKIINVNKGARL